MSNDPWEDPIERAKLIKLLTDTPMIDAVSKVLEDKEQTVHRELCVKLLNDDHGITEAGYLQLLSLNLVPEDIQEAVEMQEGRFFLPEDFPWDSTTPHQLEMMTYDDGTYLLLSETGEVLAVSGNSEFDDIGKAPTEKGTIVQIIGSYFPEKTQ